MSTATTDRPAAETAPGDAWAGFAPGPWQETIDVRDFILRNYTPYSGDASFLAGPTEKTLRLWITSSAPTSRRSAGGASTTSTPRPPPTSTRSPPGTSARTTT